MSAAVAGGGALEPERRLQALQQRLGYHFQDQRLLQRALTHRSFSDAHNERLEFLGDAVLGLVVAQWLYAGRRHGSEGDLSRMRANLVREDSLHQAALGLDLGPCLYQGAAVAGLRGRMRKAMLADAVEAVIGAVYLDGGLAAADALVQRILDLDSLQYSDMERKDAKTSLQEWLQARGHPLPQYKVLRTLGAAHMPTFVVECRLARPPCHTTGQGSSHRRAEQAAAASMLAQLQEIHDRG